jgi:uncharacterized Zn finger protein
LVEGRLVVEGVVLEPNDERYPIVAGCRGDSGRVYRLGFDRHSFDWYCDCEARGVCSHLVALMLVTTQPNPGSGGEFPS